MWFEESERPKLRSVCLCLKCVAQCDSIAQASELPTAVMYVHLLNKLWDQLTAVAKEHETLDPASEAELGLVEQVKAGIKRQELLEGRDTAMQKKFAYELRRNLKFRYRKGQLADI